jgi:hypothetical protein
MATIVQRPGQHGQHVYRVQVRHQGALRYRGESDRPSPVLDGVLEH